jgi:CPA1 family monovalent cation:H+ antiporter
MRGVISLALALSLPATTETGEAFPARSLIIVVTFVVVLITLIGQGLTLPMIIDRLRVRELMDPVDHQEYDVQIRMAQAAERRIAHLAAEAGSTPGAVERVRQFYAERIRLLEKRQHMTLASPQERAEDSRVRLSAQLLLTRVLQEEHSTLQELRRMGSVAEPMARHIQSRLDAIRQLDGK